MPAKTTSLEQAPYDPRGNLLHFAPSRPAGASWGVDPRWRGNEPFTATLTIDRTKSGRSAKYVIWRDPAGHEFPMFIVDLVDLAQHATVRRGTVVGRFHVRKRGQNYGIALAPGPQPEDATDGERAGE